MRWTVIDIGTNTMLMLIGEFDKSASQIKTILDTQRIPRLGKGVDGNKNISGDSFRKAIEILNDYKQISREYNSNNILATGTSYLRDANNKIEFIEAIKNETGIEIEILSGDDEARWSFWGGAYEQLKISNYEFQICTIDIGGGSTEIVTGNIPPVLNKNILLNQALKGKSIDIGSVRLRERYLNKNYISQSEIDEASAFIKNELDRIFMDSNNTKLIGIAGTITTLAAVKLGLNTFDRNAVDGVLLNIDDINRLLNDFIAKSIYQIKSMGDFMEGRADIIIPGILILKIFMEKFGFEYVTVSTKGLRYGILLREFITKEM